MSAQSSARSKRRQSALFSSKSLLPLPQISISSIATSTPARGNQRQLPAPLPTPGPSEAHLLGTPARIQDGNATFFGFSPGVEANETALLAVDYRSIRREDDARDEQSHEDIFDDTAILEQRAFANRRCSNEGDQSLGGLGALIFSNLIAGNQAQEALERLELGRRRDGNTSRQSITLSPVRRNASFTLSTAGEYLVDYETDVRFGDDLQDVYDQAADASLDNKRISSNVPPASFDFRSSPIKSLYPSSSPHVVNKSILHMTTSRQENLVEHHLDDQQSTLYPAESTLGHSRAFSEAFQETSRPAIMEEMEVPGKDVFTVDQPTHGPLSPGSSRRTVEQSSAISPASVRSAISVPAEPSPTMAEKRLARRMRRGLTASMAVLLSPVAEDRDKEKSMSRSRSMLCEAVEDQCSHRSHVEAETGHPSVQNHSDRTLHPPTEQDTQTHTEDAPANVQEFSIQQTESENGCNAEKHVPPPVSTEMAELIPLASLLTASVPNVDYSANLSAHGSSRVYAPPSDSLAVPSEAVSAVIHHPPKLALKRQSVKAASNPTPAVNLLKRQHTLTQKEGPSYLKPTLSRSIQQRDTVPLRRSVSLSSTQIVGNAASLRRTASHSVVRQAPKPSQTTEIGREPLELSVDKKCVASTSGSVAASQSTAPVSKKHSVDDFFERRQRDGGKVSIAMQGKGEGKESDRIVHEPQEPRGPEAGKTAVSSDVMQASRSTTDDALTIPRGFAFAHTRRARNTASKEAQTASQKAPLRVKQSINQSAALREHSKSMHKARRVLPAENERLDGSDPEIGSGVPLTTAALAAQENALEASQMVHEDATAQAGPSESFDRTSQSQMLQRYLRELAEIEVEDAAREANKAPLAHPGVLERMPLAQHGRRDKRALREESNTAAIAEQPPKRRRVAERSTSGFNRQEGKAELRAPLQSISTATLNQSRKPPVPSGIIKGPGATSKEQPKPRAKNVISAPARPAPKVTDFTFQVVGQQQLSFQERLAAWQAREAEAAKLGKPMLQPLALPVKDSAKEARKADKHLVSKPKRPTQAKEFSWHSDKRAKERKDWEDRLREKEQILAELAEIRRLEAEAAEIEAVRKMRAAQIPIAHPVPAFIRSRSKRHA